MSNTRFGGRWLKVATAAVIGSALLAPVASYARSAEGDRNTALGLGVLSAILFSNHNSGAGLLAAGGALYAYDRSQQASDKDRYSRYDGNKWGRGRDDHRDRNNDRGGSRDWNDNGHRNGDRH